MNKDTSIQKGFYSSRQLGKDEFVISTSNLPEEFKIGDAFGFANEKVKEILVENENLKKENGELKIKNWSLQGKFKFQEVLRRQKEKMDPDLQKIIRLEEKIKELEAENERLVEDFIVMANIISKAEVIVENEITDEEIEERRRM